MSMALSERVEFEALKRRVAALEARLSGEGVAQQPDPLRQRNAAQKADAARLDEAISKLLDGHPLADELTAPQIHQALQVGGYTPLPSERTVRMHLAKLRGNGNTARVAACEPRTCCERPV